MTMTKENPGAYAGANPKPPNWRPRYKETVMPIVHVALGENKHAKVWDQEQWPWETVQALADFPRGDFEEDAKGKDGPAFVFGLLRNGSRRAKDVLSRSAITLDADALTPAQLDELLAGLRSLDVLYVVYTTYSSTAAAPCVRVVVLAERSMDSAEYKHVTAVLMQHLGWDQFDPCSLKPGQFMYLPTVPAAGMDAYHTWQGGNAPLDVDAYLAQRAPAQATPAAPVTGAAAPGPVWARMTPAQQVQADEQVQRRVKWWRAHLAEASEWDDGWRDANGRGWEALLMECAYTLAALAHSPWNNLRLDGAEMLYDDIIVPAAMAQAVPGKWAAKAHGDKALEGLPWDPEQEFEPLDDDSEPSDDDSQLARGWRPVALRGYLDGTFAPPEATLMPRMDGVPLIYPGMTHSFHGESESGKSMLLQAETARILQCGGKVLYLDYEADPASVLDRLRRMGTTAAQILDGFTYVQPDADYGFSTASREAFDALLTHSYDLAVLDGVNEALSQTPVNQRSTAGLGGNDDVTTWHMRLPRQLTKRTGAGVALIDHTAKGPDAGRWAIGSQAKMAAITGAAYTVRSTAAMGRGLVGEIEIALAKDRHGSIREHASGEYGKDRTQLVAVATVDGTGGGIRVELMPPPAPPTHDQQERLALQNMAERVSIYFRQQVMEDPEHSETGVSKRDVRRGVRGKESLISQALEWLVARGYVAVFKPEGGRYDKYRGIELYSPAMHPVESPHDLGPVDDEEASSD